MSNKQSSHKALAEVIESSLNCITAQCWQWDTIPSFGSLICVTQPHHTLLGIVTTIQTGSMDPMRYPFPYQKTEEELKAQHPQIFEFLKTTFTGALVGYQTGNTLHYMTPPRPAKIHAFVHLADQPVLEAFCSRPDFLPLLINALPTPGQVDELFLALMGQLALAQLLTPERFEQYYHTFSLLIGNDYRRLKLLMQRITAQHAKLLTPYTP